VDGLHDLLEMAMAWLQHRAPWWAVLLLGVVAAAALAWIARRLAAAWPRLRHAPAWRFVALALLCVVGAQAFDVLASQRNMLARLGEELLELHAALALLFAASRITSRRTPVALRGARPGSRRDPGSSP
jgi:hypothetical protein